VRRLVLLALCAACGAAQQPSGGGRVRVEVRRPPAVVDSAKFEAHVTARRCGSGRGLVLEGVDGGNGVLVWIRFAPAESLTAGPYAMLVRGDTVARRGAVATVRWMQGEAAHGMLLDSGTVTVSSPPVAGRMSASAAGSGIEYIGARRASVTAVFSDVRVAAETTGCGR
jgi:hypothetical protein